MPSVHYIYHMEMDAIKIETLVNGERIGTIISLEHESRLQSEDGDSKELYQANLIYAILKKQVGLFEVDELVDGTYRLELFQRVYLAAPIVPEGQPIPVFDGKDMYSYMGESDID